MNIKNSMELYKQLKEFITEIAYRTRLEFSIKSRVYKAKFKKWKEKKFGLRRIVLKEILYGDKNSPGYYKQLETNKLLEMWIAKRIGDGQTQRRQELVQKQNEIKELELFIDFLEKLRK